MPYKSYLVNRSLADNSTLVLLAGWNRYVANAIVAGAETENSAQFHLFEGL